MLDGYCIGEFFLTRNAFLVRVDTSYALMFNKLIIHNATIYLPGI